MTWEPVIGLEIHVQLKTRTKMFCRCEAGWGAAENTRTCPICLAHPGALPVTNGRAVEWTVKLGLALGCTIAERAVFARKNYFYPDLPKGYQISQYDLPLCIDGKVLVPTADGEHEVRIVRAHLEEDAAKTIHHGGHSGRIGGASHSVVDFNRGGTPLVEIVTHPDIHSAEEARRFLQLLRQTIVELGISDAEMEKGTLRVDANVSVRPAGEDGFRTRTEIKNINSFSFVARGIEAEVERQIAVWESGGEVEQATFDFDASTGALTSRRSKEEAEDYRYFPEPDLVPVEPSAELIERLRAELPELPGERIRRLEPALGFALAGDIVTSGRTALYESLLADGLDPREVANFLMNEGRELEDVPNPGELQSLLKARREIPREQFAAAVAAAGDAGFSADAVPRGEGRQRHLGARAADRLDPRREPVTGRGLPRRQGRAARLLRRPGDEGDAGQGRREARQRACSARSSR